MRQVAQRCVERTFYSDAIEEFLVAGASLLTFSFFLLYLVTKQRGSAAELVPIRPHSLACRLEITTTETHFVSRRTVIMHISIDWSTVEL